MDETYVGGKEGNKHWDKKLHAGRGPVGRFAVAGARDRETDQVSAAPVGRVTKERLQGFVRASAAPGAQLYSDEAAAYAGMPECRHEAVKHAVGEYVRDMAHANGIESFWSLLERACHGTFQHISPQHLRRYVNEFAGRHNLRVLDAIDQMHRIASGLVGKSLPCRKAGARAPGRAGMNLRGPAFPPADAALLRKPRGEALRGTAASVQAPLSIPIKADGSFGLPPGTEAIAYRMETLSGAGENGYGGDGGPAATARLGSSTDVAADAAGNVCITDGRLARRLEASSGRIETVFETDGCELASVAVDSGGNVYVGGGRRIRMIDAEGRVSVIAGTGTNGSAGDGEPAGGAELSVSGMAVDRFGAVWFADPIGRRIRPMEPWPGRN